MPAPVILTVVFTALLLVAEQRGSLLGKWLTKPAASAGFIWLALERGATGSAWGQVVLVALVLSLVGDVLLIPRDKRAFLVGLLAFLLGHVAFCVAFLLRGVAAPPAAIAALPLAAGGALVLRWLWPHLSARMAAPVTAYVVVISAMVALAVGSAAHTFDPRLLGGAVLFFLSDLAVARNRFVSPGFENRLVGLPLYYAGQLLLAATVDGQLFATFLLPLVGMGGV